MMNDTEIRVAELVHWSESRRVETKYGPRNLRSAKPNEEFWAAWKSDKQTLRDAGISLGKDRQTGEWEACWWQPIAKEEAENIEAVQEASRATDADIDIPCPEGLEYMPFQRAGIAYVAGKARCAICDEMGLGKTIQAIGIINNSPEIGQILVICPASLRLNWQRELAKWLVRPMKIAVVQGGKADDWEKSGADAADVLIVNYDIVKKHRTRLDARGEFDLMIVDEAHYLKNQKAQRTRAIYGNRKSPGINAARTLCLTGTPMVNRPIELFSFLQHADPKGLGRNFFAYAKRYCNAHRNSYGWDFTGASNLPELQRKLREKFMVRRLKADVLTDLPAKRRQVIELPQNGCSAAVKAEARAAAQHEDSLAELQAGVELAKASDDPGEYKAAVAALRKASGIAFGEMARARHDLAVSKVPPVIEHLTTILEGGQPVVCFAWHKDVIAALGEAFPSAVSITGETKLADRQKAVDDFQAGKSDLFLGNIQAAGVGITLTRSSHVVFAELDWTPAGCSQAEDRCHRIGQTDSVLVQHLVVDGSLDATMAHAIVKKQAVLDAALDDQTDVEPVAPTRERPSTVMIGRNEIAEAAEHISDSQQAAIHKCLAILLTNCDGARARDGAGFSKVDARLGKSLAARPTITKRQAALGLKLCTRYRRQLPGDLSRAAGVREAKGTQ